MVDIHNYQTETPSSEPPKMAVASHCQRTWEDGLPWFFPLRTGGHGKGRHLMWAHMHFWSFHFFFLTWSGSLKC